MALHDPSPPRKILIVEEDQILRMTLAHLLRSLGHQVREVRSAEDARFALTAFTPDVALLEIQLPGIPGDAFAHYVRHKAPHAHIILLADEYRAGVDQQGGLVVSTLLKPVNFNALLALLAGAPPPAERHCHAS